ncbi:MAG: hypothetical protein ISP40_09845 [Alphaproteobacteria bacterium]|nr:hypothetical protein [Alphaproteobacteria bacterium]
MVNINTNYGALMAAKGMTLVQRNVEAASLRLSSGLRVNSASDDAAGLAVSNKMVAQIRGMEVAFKNTSDGISLLQAASAGMQTSLDISQKLRELALQSHNGVYVDDDRQNLQVVADTLLGELNRVATQTKFNGINLLDGSFNKDMRVGNTNPEIVNVTIDGMGINKHVEGESYASGHSTQILSPIEYAYGTSEFGTPSTAFANGETNPVYLASATASGISAFDLPSSSQAALLSSAPSYLPEDYAVGVSEFNIPAQSNGVGTSNPFVNAFSNAEVRSNSISSSSNFTEVGFQNGDFTDGSANQNGDVVSIPGWDIFLRQPELDGDAYQIGGFQVPLDNNVPFRGNERQSNALINNLSSTNINNLVRNGALYLEQGGYNHDSFAVTRGPYVISQDAVALEVGDSVSFEWFGLSGGDAYDVYGYLLNEDDGSTVELLNQTGTRTGSSTLQLGMGVDGWIPASTNINIAGNYKFVFIAGSFDLSGGRWLGNGLAIRNVDVTQANPPSVNEFRARVTVQAVESNEVRINKNLLVSAGTSEANDPGGNYSILPNGSDFNLFTIDATTGDIVSNQPLSFDSQENYKFEIQYTGPGGVEHIEEVNIKLTPHDEAFSIVTANESNNVQIETTALENLQNFIDFETNRGTNQGLTYALSSYTDRDMNPANDGDPNDFLQFSVDQNSGIISSNGPLDFSTQSEFKFNLTATAADGRTYVDHITLNLEDTFDSQANLSVEETDTIKIQLSELTASSDFQTRYPGGNFSIPATGLDNNLFNIVGNEIIANQNFRIPNKNSYQFDLLYSDGVAQHTERVTVNLTRFLQSDSSVTADESERIGISIDDLTHITTFASDDNYAGSFRLERYDNADGNPANDGDPDDFSQFYIANDTREIYSQTPLDYTVEDVFHFNIVYTASDGTEFTDRIILTLEDTLFASATLEVEEADQIVINISDLHASNTYSTLNPGGVFSIIDPSNLFQVQGNQIIANNEFRLDGQSQYNIQLLYTHGGILHTENIQIDLTRFMQAQGTFTAQEAENIFINNNDFTHLHNYASDNPGGRFELTGTDAAFFGVSNSGTVYSLNEIDFDDQQTFNLTLNYTDGIKTFSSAVVLGIEDTLGGQATLLCEEAQSVIVNGNLLTSLTSYAAKDNNRGSFKILEQGDYDKFSIASDGTLTSIGELRMSEKPVLDVYIEYSSDTIDSYVEHVEITLTPTSYDHSRSEYSATESGSVVIIPQINQFLQSYAEADNFAGRFEISQSPYTTEPDYNFFDIDSGGRITSKGRLDFEEGQTEFEVTVFYHHSSGTKKYTDFRRLEITNDTRDDNNLALEGIDISTRKGAAEAANLLNEVIIRISSAQAKLGAIENRFTHNLDNLSMTILKSEQANGRILDADYAIESARLARSQILDQAATNMLVGANQAKQNLLMLLQ